MTHPRILLEGVGSVGGTIAGELLVHGHAVTLVTGNADITAAIMQNGLHLTTPERAFKVAARAVTTLAELPATARFDCAFLLMMAGAVEAAARATVPWLAAGGYIVSFQNGIVGDLIAAHSGAARVISASVVFGATMEAPGRYRCTTRGRIFIGEADGRITPRINALKDLLDQVTETRVSDNIAGVLWAKLAWNCAVSALCAVSGLLFGEVVASARGQALFLLVYREALDTARAHGVVLERIVIDHARYYLPPGAEPALRAIHMAAVAGLADKYADVKPSALQTLLRGRKTEIPYLNGYLARQAEAAGRSAPINAALTRMITEIEQGERRLVPANLAALDDLVSRYL